MGSHHPAGPGVGVCARWNWGRTPGTSPGLARRCPATGAGVAGSYLPTMAAVPPPNTGPPNTGLANTGLANTGLANTGLANTGLANNGLANTGLANTGLANNGLAGPTGARPRQRCPGSRRR
jgi:PPE-repeat protein